MTNTAKITDIIKIGAPILAEKAQAVENFGSKELDEVIEHLFYNMNHYNGAGIAAPQLGINQRILVYGFDHNPRYPNEKAVPLTVLINPVITKFSEELIGYYEGCLSVPKLRGQVIRSIAIEYQAYTPKGEQINKKATGFEARIIQHEIDHLDGMLFPMRMHDMKTLQYSEK